MKNTLFIVWNEEKSLGIPIIDEQHRGIISTINSLYYFIQNGRGDEVLKPTLTILEQYTTVHFKTEEDLMKKAKYPSLDQHMAYHEALVEKTHAIADSWDSSREPESVLKFLKDWWLNHISKEDLKYAPYLKIL